MSSTTAIPATVTVSGEIVLEVLAALEGLNGYFARVKGQRLYGDGYTTDSELGEWCLLQANDLEAAAFGPAPGEGDGVEDDDGDGWLTWPLAVERSARGEEKTAVLLELHVEEEVELVREDFGAMFTKGAIEARARAEKTRAAGRIDFWNVDRAEASHAS